MNGAGPDSLKRSPDPAQVPPVKSFDWVSAIQLAVSLSAGALFLAGAILSGLFLVVELARSSGILPGSQILSSWLLSAGLGFGGLLTIPSSYYSSRRLFGSTGQVPRPWKGISSLFYLFPFLVLAGWLVQNGPDWSQGLLVLIHPLANSAVVFWVLSLAYRRIGTGSGQRFWGALGGGLTAIPAAAFLVEILILIGLVIFWGIVLSFQPGLQSELLTLAETLQSGNPSPEFIQGTLGQILSQPGIMATVFLYIAILIPLVEEILKTAVLWPLLGRALSPREGFLIGAASGAGYALFENLTIGATAEAWTLVTVTRIGTAGIHILTTGMVGWGLTSAFTEKRYPRLAGTYLAAVVLHGVWNGLNIFTALASMPQVGQRLGEFGTWFAEYASAGLLVLAAGVFGGILKANSWFRRAIMAGSEAESEV